MIEARTVLQKQQKGNVRKVKEIDINSLYEGEPRMFYIEGHGLFSVVRFNNQIWYNLLSS